MRATVRAGTSRVTTLFAPSTALSPIVTPGRSTTFWPSHAPRPIVMFSADGDTDKIREAVRAGVSAYVVGGLAAERVQPILDVAIARLSPCLPRRASASVIFAYASS